MPYYDWICLNDEIVNENMRILALLRKRIDDIFGQQMIAAHGMHKDCLLSDIFFPNFQKLTNRDERRNNMLRFLNLKGIFQLTVERKLQQSFTFPLNSIADSSQVVLYPFILWLKQEDCRQAQLVWPYVRL